jgi:multidrug resistance efflux pump
MKHHMNRRSIPITIGVLLSLAIVAWYTLRQPEPTTENPHSLQPEKTDVVFPVVGSVAYKHDLIQRTRASGRLRARRELELVARVGGEVSAVYAHNGKYVREGDLIVKLDDREYRLAYEKARSSLLAAQIEYRSLSATPFLQEQDSIGQEQHVTRAEDALEHARRAHASGMLSEVDLARAGREFETTIAYLKAQRGDVVANKSALTAARQELERARMNLEWTEVRAPFSGYVANCDLMPGTQVQPGKIVALLLDLKSFLVDVELLESEAGRVQSGQHVTARVVALPR